MLERYFRTVGDYRRHLDAGAARRGAEPRARSPRSPARASSQTVGPAPRPSRRRADRDLICALYDERRAGGRTASRSCTRSSSGPTSSPSCRASRCSSTAIRPRRCRARSAGSSTRSRRNDAARERVRALVHQLDVSALQLELGHFAVHMGWMTREEFRSARRRRRAPAAAPPADQRGGRRHVRAAEARAGRRPLRVRGPSRCALPRCPRASAWSRASRRPATQVSDASRGARSMRRTRAARVGGACADAPPAAARRRLLTVVAHLGDPSPEVTERLRWIFKAQRPLPRDVRRALEAQAPELAAGLPQAPSPSRCRRECGGGGKSGDDPKARRNRRYTQHDPSSVIARSMRLIPYRAKKRRARSKRTRPRSYRWTAGGASAEVERASVLRPSPARDPPTRGRLLQSERPHALLRHLLAVEAPRLYSIRRPSGSVGASRRVHSPENRWISPGHIADAVMSKTIAASAAVTCQSPRAISRSSCPGPQPA